MYGIVKQNDGFVHVYSEPGQGTTFRIFLPITASAQAAAPSKLVSEAQLSGTETVMIVEDDTAILELGRSILKPKGYTVLVAATPKTAIELAKSHDTPIDLLITDVVMPQMNGRQLAERLCTTSSNLKCLFMSGYTADVIAHSGILDEGVNFIAKLFSVAELVTKVRKVLDEDDANDVCKP